MKWETAVIAAFIIASAGAASAGTTAYEAALNELLKGETSAALAIYQEAASEHKTWGEFGLGYMYASGVGVKTDSKLAMSYFRLAASQGYVPAEYEIATYYTIGSGLVEVDIKKAAALYTLLANADYVLADEALGKLYVAGVGVTGNEATAFSYYMKAAEGGDPQAQLKLVQMYYYGTGMQSPDYVQAYKWLTIAKQVYRGQTVYRDAISTMTSTLRSNMTGDQRDAAEEEATQWEQNHVNAEASGSYLPFVSPDVQYPVTYAQFEAIENAPAGTQSTFAEDLANAQAGDVTAEYNVALDYQDGNGIQKNAALAAQWYEKAAKLGSGKAEYALATLYDTGLGVAKDVAAAEVWYNRAAMQGVPEAEYNLAYDFFNGQGTAKDYVSAFRWYNKAAATGLSVAQFNLGLMYENGQGVPQNYVEAYKWFILAKSTITPDSATYSRCTSEIQKLQKELTPDLLNKAQAEAAAWKPAQEP